ncbi:MAG TPA: dTDP-4-dehydrorhamnose reductase [Parafilimonas sp.]|nr:dTDP-4-dehydrorhamnose reductase [Parafilimonas sp.]
MTVLVSGKNGQLGKELQAIASYNKDNRFIFFDKDELNIADNASLQTTFQKYSPSFFINCAAYTAVDKAETEQEKAYLVNAEAVSNIAKHCHRFKTKLVHISTDYVFDGKATQPYKEDDKTDPVNYYGYTKWLGEQLALNNNPGTIVIRTSWVYSTYGNNFVKTMLRLMKERKEINVVNDQLGSPTYAKDLAEAIVEIVNRHSSIVKRQSSNVNRELSNVNLQSAIGNLQSQEIYPSPLASHVYHFSNDGIISWYDFAVAIKEIKQLDCIVNPIPTTAYPTPAKRPAYSVFDKTKIKSTFNIQLKNWKKSLEECLNKL